MNYRLCILTDPDDAEDGSDAAFGRFVSPTMPDRIDVVVGRGCGALRELWALAAEPGPDWVFWLPTSTEFIRRVALDPLAYTLASVPRVAQMALVPSSANDEQRHAGGLVPMLRERGALEPRGQGSSVAWFEHRGYWQTGPSLFPAAVPRWYAWPDGDECVADLSERLRADGRTLGLWGAGDPWVK